MVAPTGGTASFFLDPRVIFKSNNRKPILVALGVIAALGSFGIVPAIYWGGKAAIFAARKIGQKFIHRPEQPSTQPLAQTATRDVVLRTKQETITKWLDYINKSLDRPGMTPMAVKTLFQPLEKIEQQLTQDDETDLLQELQKGIKPLREKAERLNPSSENTPTSVPQAPTEERAPEHAAAECQREIHTLQLGLNDMVTGPSKRKPPNFDPYHKQLLLRQAEAIHNNYIEKGALAEILEITRRIETDATDRKWLSSSS